MALRGNAGKAQQAQAKRGWGGAKATTAAKREPSAALYPATAAVWGAGGDLALRGNAG